MNIILLCKIKPDIHFKGELFETPDTSKQRPVNKNKNPFVVNCSLTTYPVIYYLLVMFP